MRRSFTGPIRSLGAPSACRFVYVRGVSHCDLGGAQLVKKINKPLPHTLSLPHTLFLSHSHPVAPTRWCGERDRLPHPLSAAHPVSLSLRLTLPVSLPYTVTHFLSNINTPMDSVSCPVILGVQTGIEPLSNSRKFFVGLMLLCGSSSEGHCELNLTQMCDVILYIQVHRPEFILLSNQSADRENPVLYPDQWEDRVSLAGR